MADVTQLKTWLSEAEAARHQLAIGTREVKVDYEGVGAVTYTQADLNRLERYIASLKADIARAEGTVQRGPIYPVPV